MSGYSAFPDIVKDFSRMRNFPRIFLRSFENVSPHAENANQFNRLQNTTTMLQATNNSNKSPDSQ